jgi:hypothetical protein
MNRRTIHSERRVISVPRLRDGKTEQEAIKARSSNTGSGQRGVWRWSDWYEHRDLVHAVTIEVDVQALMRRLEAKAANSRRGFSQMAHGAIRVTAREIKGG